MLQAAPDTLILVPNAVGFLLGLFQLVLCVAFPQDPRWAKQKAPLQLLPVLLAISMLFLCMLCECDSRLHLHGAFAEASSFAGLAGGRASMRHSAGADHPVMCHSSILVQLYAFFADRAGNIHYFLLRLYGLNSLIWLYVAAGRSQKTTWKNH